MLKLHLRLKWNRQKQLHIFSPVTQSITKITDGQSGPCYWGDICNYCNAEWELLQLQTANMYILLSFITPNGSTDKNTIIYTKYKNTFTNGTERFAIFCLSSTGNSLLAVLRLTCVTVQTFRTQLKTQLFSCLNNTDKSMSSQLSQNVCKYLTLTTTVNQRTSARLQVCRPAGSASARWYIASRAPVKRPRLATSESISARH